MAWAFEGFYTAPQLARWLAAMPRRFSCRDYVAMADAAQVAALAYTAERVCLHGVRIALLGRDAGDLVVTLPLFPRFKGVEQAAVILADKALKQAAFLAGVSGEAFQLELASMGLQGCWVSGNYSRAAARALATPQERVMAVMPFGVPRDPEGARLTRRKILTAFSPDDPTLWPYWAYRAAEAMRSAPSALNRQPWRVSFSGNTLSFSALKGDSLDAGIAALHLECALHEYSRFWRLASDRKTLLVQVGDAHEPV